MVDYSKWDKLSLEISDDEDDKRSVGFTRLEGKGRVTIDQQGVTINDEPEEAGDNSIQQVTTSQRNQSTSRDVSTRTAATKTSTATLADEQKLSDEMQHLLTENGKETDDYLWSQTRSEVILRIKLPADAKGSQLDVKLEAGYLDVMRNDNEVFHKKLRYPIDTTDEDDLNAWEVMDIPALGEQHRYLCLTLRKMSAIPGATFWWNSVFEGDPEIDVTAIPGRNMAHVDAWQQAQRLFKEKVRAREPIALQIDDDDNDDDDDDEEVGETKKNA